MWGQEDWLADPEVSFLTSLMFTIFTSIIYILWFTQDVAWIASQLSNLEDNIKIPDNNFNHADFLYHVNATALCYDYIIEKMDSIFSSMQ